MADPWGALSEDVGPNSVRRASALSSTAAGAFRDLAEGGRMFRSAIFQDMRNLWNHPESLEPSESLDDSTESLEHLGNIPDVRVLGYILYLYDTV